MCRQHPCRIEPTPAIHQGMMSMSAFMLKHTLLARDEAMPTDLLAELLVEDTGAATAEARDADRLPAKIYAVMGVTTIVTFVTLQTGYELLFPQQLFG